MLMVQKLVVSLIMMCSVMLVAHPGLHAKPKLISLQEAIDIALKNNFNIQMAEYAKNQAIISNKIDNCSLWAPRATFKFSHTITFVEDAVFFQMESNPFFKLQWEFSSLFDKIFQTKIHGHNNFLHKLMAKKTIEKELKQVVTAYYALALAPKKWELSHNLIKLAKARLKIEEEKLRVKRISKIDCLDAQLALKQVKLTLLERQEALNGKRRSLNLILGKPIDAETLVPSTIAIQPIWDIKAVAKAPVVGLEVAIQEKQLSIAAVELRRAKAYPLSCLSLSGSFQSSAYSYTYDADDQKWEHMENFPVASKWVGSIGISIDIATLLLMPAKLKKASIGLNNAKFALQQQKLAVADSLEDKKWQYRHALDAHKVAGEQLKISKQKLIFVREKYRLKQVKLLELHEAEEATQQAEIDLIEHAFKVKQAEFDLYQLVGMFHQELS